MLQNIFQVGLVFSLYVCRGCWSCNLSKTQCYSQCAM